MGLESGSTSLRPRSEPVVRPRESAAGSLLARLATSGSRRKRLGSLARQTVTILAGLLLLLAAPVRAAEDPAEEQYRHRPQADLAASIGKKALEAGQLARGMNWLERAARSPGANWQHQALVTKMRGELKWRLADAGIGMVQIGVHPPGAAVEVDGVEILPRGAVHVLWLKEGGHTVAAESPPDYGAISQTFSTRRGEKVGVDLHCPLTRAPALLVYVKQDAEVWIDNGFAGRASKHRFVLAPGTHLVELREPGYISWVHELSFAIGEDKRFDVDLEKVGADTSHRHQASQVDRPLLPTELEERGDHRDLSARPDVDSPLEHGRQRPDVDRTSGGGATGATGRKIERVPDEVRGTAEPMQARADPVMPPPGADVSRTEEPSAPGTPWKHTTKGWMFTTVGIAAAGTGVALAVLGAQAAEKANEDRTTLGDDAAYHAAYDKGQQQSQIGYAAAGVGAVGLGVGAYYLLGDGGLSRKGKGWLLTGLGAAAAGVATWLVLDARSVATQANELKLPDPDYDRRFDTAERNVKIGQATAAGGVALIGAGLYLAFTGGGTSAAVSEPEQPAVARRWQLVPWLSARTGGGTLALGW